MPEVSVVQPGVKNPVADERSISSKPLGKFGVGLHCLPSPSPMDAFKGREQGMRLRVAIRHENN